MLKSNVIVFLTGGLIGAILLTVVSLSAGWFVTSGAAEQYAENATHDAVITHLAPLCVKQFNAEPDSASRLEVLRGMNAWQRESNIRENGWATMPGADGMASGVARVCAERLIAGTP